MAISRSPSEHFIKFLVSQKEHEPNAILNILQDFGLEGISASYIRRVEQSLSPIQILGNQPLRETHRLVDG